MTLGEFKETHKNAPDNSHIAVLLSDGDLNYALSTWQVDDRESEDHGTIIITGN